MKLKALLLLTMLLGVKQTVCSQSTLAPYLNSTGSETLRVYSNMSCLPNATYYGPQEFIETGVLSVLGDPKVEDADEDGVSDFYDLCPSTPSNSMVTTSGCPVFSLPPDSFQLKVTDATCPSAQNGSIEVSTNLTTDSYNIEINGETYQLDPAQQNSLLIDQLGSENYMVCISPKSVPDYTRCYTVTLGAPSPLSVVPTTSWETRTMSLALNGGGPYQITHNNQTYSTTAEKIDLALEPGRNTISVKAASDCQGTFATELFVSEKVRLFPNPASDFVTLYLGGSDPKVTLTLTDLDGRKLIHKTYEIAENRELRVTLDGLSTGLYVLRLSSDSLRSEHKLIKQ